MIKAERGIDDDQNHSHRHGLPVSGGLLVTGDVLPKNTSAGSGLTDVEHITPVSSNGSLKKIVDERSTSIGDSVSDPNIQFYREESTDSSSKRSCTSSQSISPSFGDQNGGDGKGISSITREDKTRNLLLNANEVCVEANNDNTFTEGHRGGGISSNGGNHNVVHSSGLLIGVLATIGLLKKDAVEFDCQVFGPRFLNALGGGLMALTYFVLSDAKAAAFFSQGWFKFSTCVCSALVNGALYELLMHGIQEQVRTQFIGSICEARYVDSGLFIVAAIGFTVLATIPSSPLLAACLSTGLSEWPVIVYMAFGVRALATALSIPKLFGKEKEIDLFKMLAEARSGSFIALASLCLMALYTFSQHSGMTKAIEDVYPSYRKLSLVWQYSVEVAGIAPLVLFNVWWIYSGIGEFFKKENADGQNLAGGADHDIEANLDNDQEEPAAQNNEPLIFWTTIVICLFTGVPGVVIAFAGHDGDSSTEFTFEEWQFIPYLFAAGAYAAAVIMNVGSTMRFCSNEGVDAGPKGICSAALEFAVKGVALLAQRMVSGVSSYGPSLFYCGRSNSDDRSDQLGAPLLGGST